MPYIHELLKDGSREWDLYTFQEENAIGKLDEYGRFLSRYNATRDYLEPIVSSYLYKKGFQIEYPDRRQFAICLTHDIDKTFVGMSRKTLNLIRGRTNGRSLFQRLADLVSRDKPNCNFKEVIDLEESYGAKSTFFLLSLKPNEKDFNYRVEELETYISEVVDRGFEIGLHGGWEAYKDRNKLHNEKTRLEKTLNKKVEGYRNHYLLFKQPETWKMLHEEGFIYDSTLAFPDGVGFRNGLQPLQTLRLRSWKTAGYYRVTSCCDGQGNGNQHGFYPRGSLESDKESH